MTKLRTRKTAYVPRIVFRVAASGTAVVPLCVTLGLSGAAGGCGDNNSFVVADACFADNSACPDGPHYRDGVADAAFDGRHVDSVADMAFTDTRPDGLPGVALDAFGVADIGFSDSPADGPLGVALDAFGGG
jgi:hypothetical protein